METIKDIMEIMTFFLTIFMAVLAWLAAKRYIFKTIYYGEEAKNVFNGLDIVKEAFIEKPYEGYSGRSFPSLIIEKKWGKEHNVTYYYKDDDKKKMVKTWTRAKIMSDTKKGESP